MKLALLMERFYDLVAPDIPNEWDAEEALELLIGENYAVCEAVLEHIPVIWPVSNSLCYNFLRLLPKTLEHLSLEQIPPWIGITLDHYETGGLRAAQRFMEDDVERYLAQLKGNGGLGFASIEKKLLPYIRGIARNDLQIGQAVTSYTDTSSIFVPEELRFSLNNDKNFLLYKLILTFQWGFIACGSFVNKPPPEFSHINCDKGTLWLRSFLAGFDEPLLAIDIYHCLESIRVQSFLYRELPGLMRAAKRHIMPRLSENLKEHPLRLLQQVLVTDNSKRSNILCHSLTKSISKRYLEGQALSCDSIALTAKLFPIFYQLDAEYISMVPLPFQGRLQLRAVENARKIREQKMGEEFAELMASYLVTLSQKELGELNWENKREGDSTTIGLTESDISMVMDSESSQSGDDDKDTPLLITINNEEFNMPAELEECTRCFFDEFGHLPANFLSSAAGKAGQAMLEHNVLGRTDDTAHLKETLHYDEWDYRRQGYRKNWCSLHFKELTPVHSSFIQNTIGKYHGISIRLRHQFEMMRSRERFVRRQREGGDIDFDALVESISDIRAGVSASDRLFIRLKRDTRDIAVIFLVDMSNSTAGWVNNALKESLVLMTEALTILGDRYGIYGFSGMRRSRCELFHVKHLEEPSGEQVKERISSIVPSEYTRMGPPIRHATRLLKEVDAKVRLIVTLTDGKPEDYDDYKGEYAIEDTRHALLEAKTAGIHPFCITIDHTARDYMKHMYGPANYIFIDNVRKLPLRIPEIYRVLTS